MTRWRFGAVLLVAVGLACLWAGAALNRFTEPVCRNLERAQEAALAEDWEQAAAHALAAETAWAGKWHGLASAADHTPLEDIDDLFAQLSLCRRMEKKEDFVILCAQLRRRLQAVSSAHTLTWWNFF